MRYYIFIGISFCYILWYSYFLPSNKAALAVDQLNDSTVDYATGLAAATSSVPYYIHWVAIAVMAYSIFRLGLALWEKAVKEDESEN